MGAVVMSADYSRSVYDWFRSDDEQNDRPVSSVNDQAGARFYLGRLGELCEAGRSRQPNDFASRSQSALCYTQVRLEVLGEVEHLGALCGRDQLPARLLCTPDATVLCE
jgi:hypothetical protein